MLPKALLDVEKRRPTIRPVYRPVEEHRSLAKDILAAYEPGPTRGEIQDATAALETHSTWKFVRGLTELLDRDATFTQPDTPIPPADLRAAVFAHGYVTTDADRDHAISRVADTLDVTPEAVEAGLWADRDPNHRLTTPPAIDPDDLVRQYNLSLTQTLLFDATSLEFTATDHYQPIFRTVKRLGLMYTAADDLAVTVDGPITAVKQTRKYGTAFAKLVPVLMRATEWSFTANIQTQVAGQPRHYTFALDTTNSDLFPDTTADSEDEYDSLVERDFATRIAALADGWTVTREPTILRTGTRVMIPDFGFHRAHGPDDTDALYVEVIGYWTPDYLKAKLEKVREVETDVPLVLAVDESLNLTTADFADANADQIFFYTDRIPVKPVLDRLHALEAAAVDRDLTALANTDLDLDPTTVTSIVDLAAHHNLEPDALRKHLTNHHPDGVISNDHYVPPRILQNIQTQLDQLGDPPFPLAATTPILNEHDLAQTILEDLGYTIRFTSLDPDDATVHPQPTDPP